MQLNVGGRKFAVSRATLRRGGGYLATLAESEEQEPFVGSVSSAGAVGQALGVGG